MSLNRLVSQTRWIGCWRRRPKHPHRATSFQKSSFQRNFSSLGGNDSSSVDYRLIEFSTLHQLQENSCQTFSANKLFGTYSSETKDFEFLTYEDVGREVNRCRTLLRSMGELEYEMPNVINFVIQALCLTI